MGRSILKRISLLFLAALMFAGLNASAQKSKFKVLVVASLAKDHWKSISVGKDFFEKLGAQNHFSVDFTTDTSVINDANMANYKVFVMFHLAPFDMSASQQAALQKFVEQGKHLVEISQKARTHRDELSATGASIVELPSRG